MKFKPGDRVVLELLTSETVDRKDRHNLVVGVLLFKFALGQKLAIAPDREGDSPNGIWTSPVKEITENNDGSVKIKTLNSIYRMELHREA